MNVAPHPALLRLERHSDDRGHLVVVTGERDIPFAIRRVYWIYGNRENRDRASHAHRRSAQLLVPLAGRCRATCEGPEGKTVYDLTDPDRALFTPPMTWLELTDFSADAVLLVVSDIEYDPDDVIVDRALFREAVR